MLISLRKYPFVSSETPMSLELTSMEVVDEEENIRYTTYGLRVLDEGETTLYAAPDIDTKKEFVERFIEFCADSDIRLIHIPDLLEDYMDRR